MPTAWSTEQVLALAPDAGSAKAGRDLASARKWVALGCNDAAIWGECQGSGAAPYQTKVALEEPAYHCSCPSRKFPCKHSLGLLLLWAGQPGALPEGEPPAWVGSWLEGRSQRAEQKAKKELERQEKREKGEPAVDVAAQKKREAARLAKVAAGLDDLGLWISDLVRHGLTSVQGKPGSLWEDQARRLIDAQAPGLARRLRQMAALPLSGDGWQSALLERLARLHLVVEGRRRLDALPSDVQHELRGVIGLPVDQDEVRAQPGVRDVWQVVGQRVEVEDRLRTQRTWLVGRTTGRGALVLDFAFGSNQPLDATLPAGTQIDAELAFFPASAPLRALVKLRHGPPEALGAPGGHATMSAGYAAYAATLARNPWLESYPLVLQDVLLQRRDETWLVRDGSDRVLPLSPRFAFGWHGLGLSGGQPITIACEFDGATLEPLACWWEGRFTSFPAAEFEPSAGPSAPLDVPPEIADLWRETSASALVGVDRRPPPSSLLFARFHEPFTALEGIDPPARLLHLAAALAQYGRVGHEPGVALTPALAPCPVDDLPECNLASAQRLGRMLDGENTAIVGEWLALATTVGRRVPNARLADVLALARRQSDLRTNLRTPLGTRGRWLGTLNPDWRFVGGEADVADPESTWQTAARPERLLALRTLRAKDPAGGRALLASTWATEPADDRAAFVEALVVGLSLEDEPFLEAALDDRGKTVRRETAGLLARLPESRFARRMSERVALLVRWDDGRLSVELPTACDAAMVRDGLVVKPPTGVGERAWWLRQLVAGTPLSFWEGLAGGSAVTVIAAANTTEWSHDLWLTWARVAIRIRAAHWALALLEGQPAKLADGGMLPSLISVLDPDQRDSYLIPLLQANPGALHADHIASPFLRSMESHPSTALSRIMLPRLREAAMQDEAATPRPRYDYTLAQFLVRLGGLLPPSLAPELETLWPRQGADHPFYGSCADQMKSLLQFRYEMHQEFAR